jgi:hypothetical protein
MTMQKKLDCTKEYRNGKNNRKVTKIKMAMRNRKEEEKQTKMPMGEGRKLNEMKCKRYFLMTLSATAA